MAVVPRLGSLASDRLNTSGGGCTEAAAKNAQMSGLEDFCGDCYRTALIVKLQYLSGRAGSEMAVLGTASTFLVQRCPRCLRGADPVLGVAAEGIRLRQQPGFCDRTRRVPSPPVGTDRVEHVTQDAELRGAEHDPAGAAELDGARQRDVAQRR